VADDEARVILAVEVTAANVNEGGELIRLLDKATQQGDGPPVGVCADAAYASGANAYACEERGVQLVSPPPPPRNGHSRETV
jgi:hypothetical protein